MNTTVTAVVSGQQLLDLMNGHTTCNCSKDETTHMHLRLLSDIERERESTACSIASND